MKDSPSDMTESEHRHEWKWQHQPIPVLRVCGWKCATCGATKIGATKPKP